VLGTNGSLNIDSTSSTEPFTSHTTSIVSLIFAAVALQSTVYKLFRGERTDAMGARYEH
jgi:hypothetical protein